MRSGGNGCRITAMLTIVLFLCLFAGRAAFADAGEYRSRITSFDVDITVGENNVYHVVNTFDMEFAPDSYSHGAYMTVDLEPYVFFTQDGEYYSRDYRVFLTNLKVSGGSYETETENGILSIRIGDPDVLVDGQTIQYRVSYDYDAGDDGFPDFDMFYYAIIGNEWNQNIDNVTFSIHMPKEFDVDGMGFSVGYTGDEGYDTSMLEYNVDGTTITGRYLGQLQPYEGIWIRIPLPADYYVNARTVFPAAAMVLWVSGGLAAAAVILFLIFRPRKHPVVTVEVEPPSGVNSADAGFIVDGSADVRDIMSLLIWWASEGYIKIVNMAPAPGKKKSDGLLFVKLKDLPEDADMYQHLLFDELFRDGDRVAAKDLKYSFSSQVSSAMKRLKSKFSSGPAQLYTTTSKFLSDLCCALAAVPVALQAAVGVYYASYGVMVAAIVVGIIVFGVCYLAAILYCSIIYRWHAQKKSTRTVQLVLCILLLGVVSVISCAAAWQMSGPWGLMMLASLGILVLAPLFRTYTEQGREWYGKILGLRKFMERAEKSRLELLAAENPEYFYDILPFAYVLGVTDVWAKQFEDLALEPPGWYSGADIGTFTPVIFASQLSRNMSMAQQDMMAVKSSGGSSMGGGGFSGGGFSGGGFGGSGGGSW